MGRGRKRSSAGVVEKPAGRYVPYFGSQKQQQVHQNKKRKDMSPAEHKEVVEPACSTSTHHKFRDSPPFLSAPPTTVHESTPDQQLCPLTCTNESENDKVGANSMHHSSLSEGDQAEREAALPDSMSESDQTERVAALPDNIHHSSKSEGDQAERESALPEHLSKSDHTERESAQSDNIQHSSKSDHTERESAQPDNIQHSNKSDHTERESALPDNIQHSSKSNYTEREAALPDNIQHSSKTERALPDSVQHYSRSEGDELALPDNVQNSSRSEGEESSLHDNVQHSSRSQGDESSLPDNNLESHSCGFPISTMPQLGQGESTTLTTHSQLHSSQLAIHTSSSIPSSQLYSSFPLLLPLSPSIHFFHSSPSTRLSCSPPSTHLSQSAPRSPLPYLHPCSTPLPIVVTQVLGHGMDLSLPSTSDSAQGADEEERRGEKEQTKLPEEGGRGEQNMSAGQAVLPRSEASDWRSSSDTCLQQSYIMKEHQQHIPRVVTDANLSATGIEGSTLLQGIIQELSKLNESILKSKRELDNIRGYYSRNRT